MLPAEGRGRCPEERSRTGHEMPTPTRELPVQGCIRITLPVLEVIIVLQHLVPGGRARSGACSVSLRVRQVTVPPRRPAVVSVVPCMSSQPGNLIAFYCT